MLNSVNSLYNENENIKKLNGFYRGTVLKHLPAGKYKLYRSKKCGAISRGRINLNKKVNTFSVCH